MNAVAGDERQRNIAVVRRLCEQWPWLGREDFAELLAEDCVYIDVPLPAQAVRGPAAAFEKLGRLRTDWDIAFDIVSIAGEGDKVLVERIEHFHNPAGLVEDWKLECIGSFEVRDGKIVSWKDYWNLGDAEPLFRFAAARQQG